MTHTLILKSSIMASRSESGGLIDHFISRLGKSSFVVRDLVSEPLPLLDDVGVMALRGAESELNDPQRALLALSNQLVDELRAADRLVIAAPMYNFHIPSQLKAWIDLICRAGVTFRYTDAGPQGLLTGKQAVVVTTRGGRHQGTEQDLITPYLSTVLRFIGIESVEFVYAEALAMGGEGREKALSQARGRLDQLAGA